MNSEQTRCSRDMYYEINDTTPISSTHTIFSSAIVSTIQSVPRTNPSSTVFPYSGTLLPFLQHMLSNTTAQGMANALILFKASHMHT